MNTLAVLLPGPGRRVWLARCSGGRHRLGAWGLILYDREGAGGSSATGSGRVALGRDGWEPSTVQASDEAGPGDCQRADR